MMGTITTRRMTDSDVGAVLELLRVALGEPPLLKRTLALWNWKHVDNPFGRSIAIVAEADRRIVGLRALMRWDLTTADSTTLRCVRAVDTATHPDYQRRGIFRRLTEEALEEAAASGVDMVFNTPNPRSGAGYLSMGWREVGGIGVLVRPALRSDRGTANLEDGTGFLEDPVPIHSFGHLDREPRGLRTPRTEKYLRWRFSEHPQARYFQVVEGSSMAVLRPNIRSGRRELVLADVFGRRPQHAIRSAARQSRAAYIGGWFAPGSPERRASLLAGMLPLPGVHPLTLMARPLHELDIDIATLAAWDLAASDLELL